MMIIRYSLLRIRSSSASRDLPRSGERSVNMTSIDSDGGEELVHPAMREVGGDLLEYLSSAASILGFIYLLLLLSSVYSSSSFAWSD